MGVSISGVNDGVSTGVAFFLFLNKHVCNGQNNVIKLVKIKIH